MTKILRNACLSYSDINALEMFWVRLFENMDFLHFLMYNLCGYFYSKIEFSNFRFKDSFNNKNKSPIR